MDAAPAYRGATLASIEFDLTYGNRLLKTGRSVLSRQSAGNRLPVVSRGRPMKPAHGKAVDKDRRQILEAENAFAPEQMFGMPGPLLR
jgi:hypothetical protein